LTYNLYVKQRKKNSLDYLIVIIFPLIATFVTIYFHTTQVTSLLLFFITPAVYLTVKIPWVLKKGLIYVLASIPFTIIIDYFAIKDGSWWVYTIFPFRVLNGIPMEDFIWCASWFYYIIVFYEYFIDEPRGGKDCRLNRRWKKLLAGWSIIAVLLLVFYEFIQQNITLPYFYAAFGISLGLIPLIGFLIWHPKIIHKFLPVALYFLVVNFLHEISALSANQWYFPGEHFIGWIQVLQFRFPIEEFSMWMVLGASYALTWYEYFEDDAR